MAATTAPNLKRRRFRAILAAGVLLALGFALSRAVKIRGDAGSDPQRYDYQSTRMLVRLTARAAALLEREGETAIEEFRSRPERWSLGGDSYLYVYDREGINLYHGGYPGLIRRDLARLTDLLGKPIHRLVLDQLDNHRESNPHGWVHYLWPAPGSLQGAWKSSCHFPATLPDGREVYVGSGLDYPQMEREFFRIIVDQAAERLEAKGRAAIAELKAFEGPFAIYDESVFVLDLSGRAILDPALDLAEPRDLFAYQDLGGNRPLRELARRLEKEEAVWVVTLDQDRAGGDPVKKGIYGRRTTMDGEPVIVGALCDLPRPAWMR
jgi:hypothetical protein